MDDSIKKMLTIKTFLKNTFLISYEVEGNPNIFTWA